MNRNHFMGSLTLAICALLGLASPARSQHLVPFKGRISGIDSGTPLVPPMVSVQVTTTGNATHLGRCTYSAKLTVNTATGQGNGTFLFTAANGATLFGTTSGQSKFTPPNFLNIQESAIILGGTGRLAGATGSFTILRVKNTVTGETTASFLGTISSPGAGH